jgi:hypothetical protein
MKHVEETQTVASEAKGEVWLRAQKRDFWATLVGTLALQSYLPLGLGFRAKESAFSSHFK